MSAVARLLRALAKGLNGIGAYVILPALVLLVTLDVVMRYWFNMPLHGGLEASQHLLLLFFILGLLESFRSGAHIKAEILTPLLPTFARRLMALLMCAALVLVFGLLVKKTIDEIPFLYSLPQLTPELHLRLWMFHALASAVSMLVALYALVAAVEILRGRRETVEEDAEPEWGE
tara:strand:- start:2732 stop:3256 length:525 start_codon:yes stop_codon:yes gene_type:complete